MSERRASRIALRLGPFSLILLLGVLLATTPGSHAQSSSTSTSASLSLSNSGTVSTTVSALDPNGSALRNAMDGNFSPLVDSLPINTSAKLQALTQIASVEVLAPALFGDHDGQVTTNDVVLFEKLLVSAGASLPMGTGTGTSIVSLTLDGAQPTSSQLAAVTFDGATGPDASAAPISVVSALTENFNFGGSSHVLAFSTNLSLAGLSLGSLTPSVGFSFSTPAGFAITSVSGLAGAHVSNDLLGWGGGSVSGTFSPTAGNPAVIHFGQAFPLGDILIGGAVVAVGVFVGLAWFRRLRRRRTAGSVAHSTSTPSTKDEEVGPSGSA